MYVWHVLGLILAIGSSLQHNLKISIFQWAEELCKTSVSRIIFSLFGSHLFYLFGLITICLFASQTRLFGATQPFVNNVFLVPHSSWQSFCLYAFHQRFFPPAHRTFWRSSAFVEVLFCWTYPSEAVRRPPLRTLLQRLSMTSKCQMISLEEQTRLRSELKYQRFGIVRILALCGS